MSAYDNVFQRPTSLLFTKYGHQQHPTVTAADEMVHNSSSGSNINLNSNVLFNSSSSNNDVFGDEQEDQIVPDCSVAPKLDLSPINDCWTNGNSGASNSHGFLTTAVHLSLQEVSSTRISLHLITFDLIFNLSRSQ